MQDQLSEKLEIKSEQEVTTIMSTKAHSISSKADKCPNCFRLLSKRAMVNNESLVHIRHRGYEAYAKQAIVSCMGCGTQFVVDGDKGILNKVEING